jgi:hypothetical protein
MMILSDPHHPSEIYERRESRPDEEFNKRLLAKAAMAADLKSETKRPTFMEDDSSQSQPTLSILRLMNHVPMTSLIKGY